MWAFYVAGLILLLVVQCKEQLLRSQFIPWIGPKCFVMDTERDRGGRRNRRLIQWTTSMMICGLFTWCQMPDCVHYCPVLHISTLTLFLDSRGFIMSRNWIWVWWFSVLKSTLCMWRHAMVAIHITEAASSPLKTFFTSQRWNPFSVID